jgi:formylglycine-generating enzyme required for sulfatase activity
MPGPAYQDAPADAQSPGMKRVLLLAAAIGGFILLGSLAALWLDLFGRSGAPPEVAEAAREPEADVMEPGPDMVAPDGTAPESGEETVAAAEPSPEAVPETAAAATESAGETGPGGVFKDKLASGGFGPEMVWIPAGTFEMGSSGSSRHTEERPRHTVKVSRFAISRYEVTIAQYEKFAKATGRPMPDTLYMEKETHPVVFVSWDDAFYYTKWLSEQTGKKYRLPSEAEWEYAAGAGRTSPFWWGFDEQPNMAHCFGCGTGLDPRRPTRTGSFQPNPFGLYDTAGNVAEWVRDCWHDTYNGAPTDGSVWEGGDCAYRVVRGGAYSSPPQSIRHAKRDRFKSDQSYDHVGFRVARDE